MHTFMDIYKHVISSIAFYTFFHTLCVFNQSSKKSALKLKEYFIFCSAYIFVQFERNLILVILVQW